MLRLFVASLAGLSAAVAALGTGDLPGAAASCQRSVAIDPQVTVSEAAGNLTFVVNTGSCPAAGSVSYVVTDGSAKRQPAPGDFALADGQLAWAAGDTSSRRITATIVDDRLIEAPLEDFKVTLVEPSAGVRVVAGAGQGRIFDNDSGRHQATTDSQICLGSNGSAPSLNRMQAPGLSLSPGPQPAPAPSWATCTIEPGHIAFLLSPIVLNTPNATNETIQFDTSDGDLHEGLDYVAVHRVVTIPAWTTGVFVEVRVLPHAFVAGGHFNVHISNYTGGGSVIQGDAQITVLP
ncbi:hypothetical protein Rhe02_49690 [Rhizocola hellebori]|uniref:Calx-beta domain-containing protein n=2 Tax=Rhizocola hellebori TaxID=1392758 RepID=A0A8J3QBM4_9ACTN|nr:hypothetical protein Rhe02_49690 [Rhizocola hellebori]